MRYLLNVILFYLMGCVTLYLKYDLHTAADHCGAVMILSAAGSCLFEIISKKINKDKSI